MQSDSPILHPPESGAVSVSGISGRNNDNRNPSRNRRLHHVASTGTTARPFSIPECDKKINVCQNDFVSTFVAARSVAALPGKTNCPFAFSRSERRLPQWVRKSPAGTRRMGRATRRRLNYPQAWATCAHRRSAPSAAMQIVLKHGSVREKKCNSRCAAVRTARERSSNNASSVVMMAGALRFALEMSMPSNANGEHSAGQRCHRPLELPSLGHDSLSEHEIHPTHTRWSRVIWRSAARTPSSYISGIYSAASILNLEIVLVDRYIQFTSQPSLLKPNVIAQKAKEVLISRSRNARNVAKFAIDWPCSWSVTQPRH